jgi:hypothetical protein
LRTVRVESKETGSYTARQGRRFGITLGLAFLALAALLAWRGHGGAGRALGALGAVLVGGGLLAPRALRPVEAAWMRFAASLSRVTTPIFMGIVYYLVITPVGLLRRAFGSNPLESGEEGSVWKDHDGTKDLRRQF